MLTIIEYLLVLTQINTQVEKTLFFYLKRSMNKFKKSVFWYNY